MSETVKVKGPASCFPSIEKTCGKPVNHWFKILDSMKGMNHMRMVSVLKAENKIGHGHVNALVAYQRVKSEA